jgi:hypothetical protein
MSCDFPPFLIGTDLAAFEPELLGVPAFDLTCFFAMLSSVFGARIEPRGPHRY